jgi:hypothetical protein
MNKTLPVLAFTATLSFSGAANALLFDRGNGLIYDDVLNITWLQDANYAATELTDTRVDAIITAVNGTSPAWLGTHVMATSDFPGYVGNGTGSYLGYMTWWGAMAWADQLVYGGYEDWMLPTVGPVNGTSFNYNISTNGSTDVGYNNTSLNAQLSYMYYVNLKNVGYCPFGAAITPPSACVGAPQPGWVGTPSANFVDDLYNGPKISDR